jgi:hypothetical protein
VREKEREINRTLCAYRLLGKTHTARRSGLGA